MSPPPSHGNPAHAPHLGLALAQVTAIGDDGYQLQLLSTALDTTVGPARSATLSAGNGRGTFLGHEVGDEVVVGFELGDLQRPVILGALWNDRDRPPAQADTSARNNRRTIVSRSGHEITLDDSPGAQRVVIRSQGGLEIVIQDAPTRRISIKSNDLGIAGSTLVIDGVSWNHQHGVPGPLTGPPQSIFPVP